MEEPSTSNALKSALGGLADEDDRARARKRGGGCEVVPLDPQTEESRLAFEFGADLAQGNGERTGVVLHLGPGLIGHTITPGGRRQADAQLVFRVKPHAAALFRLKAVQ